MIDLYHVSAYGKPFCANCGQPFPCQEAKDLADRNGMVLCSGIVHRGGELRIMYSPRNKP